MSVTTALSALELSFEARGAGYNVGQDIKGLVHTVEVKVDEACVALRTVLRALPPDNPARGHIADILRTLCGAPEKLDASTVPAEAREPTTTAGRRAQPKTEA
jgi:hypothetical protein